MGVIRLVLAPEDVGTHYLCSGETWMYTLLEGQIGPSWPLVGIDVVPDEVKWMVNWLHYLNYESISSISSTCYLVRIRNNIGQTASYYRWCNGIPCVVSLFKSFLERFASDRIYYRR